MMNQEYNIGKIIVRPPDKVGALFKFDFLGIL